MKATARLLLGAGLLVCVAACAPMHTVKPLRAFVEAGLEPGDTITVTTRDGETHKFVLKERRGDFLVGENNEFALQELTSIKKHAWSRPELPCDAEEPRGCSVPVLISLSSKLHAHYKEEFYDACMQHDYCYGHGQATYGTDRESCDNEFLLDMQNLCPDAATSGVGKVLQTLDGSMESRRACLSVANDFYGAVRRYGEDKYLTETSSYCEYNGPPPVGAPQPAPAAATPR